MPVAIIGHRGARGLHPENTLEGFRAALRAGVARFELDAGISADGVVVVHHDPALNPDLAREPDGGWIAPPPPLLKELTQAEIARFDVGRIRPGSPTAARFPDQVPIDGARIPTLAAVLALPAHFTIEVKSLATRPEATIAPEAMAERVAAAIDRGGRGRPRRGLLLRLARAARDAPPASGDPARLSDQRGDGRARAALVGRRQPRRAWRLGRRARSRRRAAGPGRRNIPISPRLPSPKRMRSAFAS